jgi:CubicO group peptidase (beta-lactamase class C family)
MTTRILAVALAVLACGLPLPAQSPARATSAVRDSVDRLVAARMASQHIPGLSLAVVRAGKVIKAEGYGVADLENGAAVTPRTVFKIGSVSKQLLAAGILMLAQDGKLAVDDPVSRHIPGTPASWSEITLRRFLNHTSGVTREGAAFDPMKVQPDSVVVRSAFAAPLEFPVGSKYQYCNVCYFALADIIARVSGKPWDAFLAERLFAPLGMSSTRTTTTTDIVPNRAHGYEWRKDGFVNATEYLALRPSGAFLSTALDLAKWDAALYGDRVLTTASRDAMWTPVRLTDGTTQGYGFGWRLDSLAGHRRTHHGGTLPGFSAGIVRYPDDSLTVIVLTNADGARGDDIAFRVGEIYLSGATSKRLTVKTSPTRAH